MIILNFRFLPWLKVMLSQKYDARFLFNFWCHFLVEIQSSASSNLYFELLLRTLHIFGVWSVSYNIYKTLLTRSHFYKKKSYFTLKKRISFFEQHFLIYITLTNCCKKKSRTNGLYYENAFCISKRERTFFYRFH